MLLTSLVYLLWMTVACLFCVICSIPQQSGKQNRKDQVNKQQPILQTLLSKTVWAAFWKDDTNEARCSFSERIAQSTMVTMENLPLSPSFSSLQRVVILVFAAQLWHFYSLSPCSFTNRKEKNIWKRKTVPYNNSREIARASNAFGSNSTATAKAVPDLGVAAAIRGTPHLLLNPSVEQFH